MLPPAPLSAARGGALAARALCQVSGWLRKGGAGWGAGVGPRRSGVVLVAVAALRALQSRGRRRR